MPGRRSKSRRARTSRRSRKTRRVSRMRGGSTCKYCNLTCVTPYGGRNGYAHDPVCPKCGRDACY